MNICTHDDQCRVLLIEDYPDHAALVTEIIRHYGKDGFRLCHHTTLADGLECIAHHADEPLDIILLDLNVGDSKGIATLEAILTAAPGVPVAVLTSFSDESLAELALEKGAQDYVVKDDVLSGGGRSLARIMRYAIARNRTRQRIREEAQRLKQAEEDLQSSDSLTLVRGVRESLAELASRGY